MFVSFLGKIYVLNGGNWLHDEFLSCSNPMGQRSINSFTISRLGRVVRPHNCSYKFCNLLSLRSNHECQNEKNHPVVSTGNYFVYLKLIFRFKSNAKNRVTLAQGNWKWGKSLGFWKKFRKSGNFDKRNFK